MLTKAKKALVFKKILGVKITGSPKYRLLNFVETTLEKKQKIFIVTPNPEQLVLASEDSNFLQALNQANLSVPDGIGLIWADKILSFSRHSRNKFGTGSELTPPCHSRNKFGTGSELTPPCHSRNKFGTGSELSRHPELVSGSASAASNGVSGSIKQRISGIDFMLDLCRLAGKKGWRVFLLGGGLGVAKKAAEKLTTKNNVAPQLLRPENVAPQLLRPENVVPQLLRPENVVPQLLRPENISYFRGAKDIKKETAKEREEAIKKINRFKPDLLFVAYGAPYQEKWLHQNLSNLDVRVGMVVGGSLDYISGKIKRAPLVLQKLGLEWFWRLLQEPWRIKRQSRLLKFIWLVLKEMINGQ